VLDEFLDALTRNLTLDRAGRTVRFEVDVGESEFGLGTMLPLGLILNELVTNSLKHAFTETVDPVIGISILRAEDRYRLVYTDNGRGMPENFDVASAATLGMVLIDSLVRQMRGTLRFENAGGLRCEIAFDAGSILD
jgi:two-component sensor histidine kinase